MSQKASLYQYCGDWEVCDKGEKFDGTLDWFCLLLVSKGRKEDLASCSDQLE